MNLDFRRICEDLEIKISNHSHHSKEGWIQICCPFCNDTSFHLGWNIEKQYFNCYRCGWLKTKKVIEELTRQPFSQIYKKYKQPILSTDSIKKEKNNTNKNRNIRCSLPPLTKNIGKPHILYLLSRKIDLKAVSVWDLKGIDNVVYGKKIVAPIFKLLNDKKELVCWATRNITNKASHRYLNCPDKLAKIPLKQTLYGQWLVEKENNIIIVEGFADAWKLGIGTIALYGTTYTDTQLSLLRKYKNKYIMLDMDETGRKAAKKLANELSAFEGEIEIISYNTKDPAELTQKDADLIKQDLLGVKCYEN